eukprot:5767778-Prymnesium_polylepis.1
MARVRDASGVPRSDHIQSRCRHSPQARQWVCVSSTGTADANRACAGGGRVVGAGRASGCRSV